MRQVDNDKWVSHIASLSLGSMARLVLMNSCFYIDSDSNCYRIRIDPSMKRIMNPRIGQQIRNSVSYSSNLYISISKHELSTPKSDEKIKNQKIQKEISDKSKKMYDDFCNDEVVKMILNTFKGSYVSSVTSKCLAYSFNAT